MPESILSYNLTRKYPYPWFAWLVVIGGIATTAIFTVINLAADGYQSNVSYLTNPNLTEHPPHLQWFQKRPWSWASKVSSSCEDVNIAIGSEFYTNSTGFFYKLISISRSTGEQSNSAGSLSYHNDALHNCAISSITVSPFPNDASAPAWQGPLGQVTTAMDCTLYEGPNPVIIGLTTTFVFNSGGVYSVQADGTVGSFDSPTFLSANNDTQASLLWGQAFITSYAWIACNLCAAFVGYTEGCDDWAQILSAYYAVQVVSPESPGETLIYASVVLDSDGLSFVYFGNYGSNDKTLITLSSWTSHFGKEMLSQDPVYTPTSNSAFPIPITNLSSNHGFQAVIMDGLVKSVYFTILTDLGQDGALNALASPTQVMKFANETHKLYEFFGPGGYAEDPGYPYINLWGSQNTTIPDFYKSVGTGILRVWPATINAQYLCQVPKLKPIGSMLVSVIVADLVFLQALWLIVTFLTTFFLERRHPQANYCDGCTKILASGHGEAIDMIPGPASKGSYSKVSVPDEGMVSPIIGSASASVRSGAVSARTGSIASVWKRNDGNVQRLLASP